MVIPDLKTEKIAAGAALLEELDRARVKVDVALWHYSSDRERWRLILSLPLFKEKGAEQAYSAVFGAIERTPAAELALETGTVSLGTNDEELLKRLRVAGRKKNNIAIGRYITNRGLQGMLLEGAYIYRLPASRRATAARPARRSQKTAVSAAGPTRG